MVVNSVVVNSGPDCWALACLVALAAGLESQAESQASAALVCAQTSALPG